MSAITSAETFHSLVEQAFSLEPHLQYKQALGSLLCALCSSKPSYFSMLLDSCSNVLIKDPATASRLLSTLAQCSKSYSCTSKLLKSDLIAQMVSRLTNGFEKLLDLLHQPVSDKEFVAEKSIETDARDSLTYLCVLLAFFTDFLRNWMPGKLWMAKESNHRFWEPMLRFLSMDTSVVTSHEVAYVQEVAFDFFSISLQICNPTKVAFVHLVCDILRQNQILTQFLHRLLTGLVFRHDTMPIIVNFVMHDPRKEASQALSLPLTYETQDYHPSQPTGDSSYILYIPVSSNLSKLDTLIKSHRVNKPQPASILKSSDRASQRRTPKVVPSSEESVSLSCASPDIENFDMKSWRESEVTKESQSASSNTGSSLNKTLLFCAATFKDKEILQFNSLTALFRHSVSGTIFSADVRLKHLQPCTKQDEYPLTAYVDNSTILFRATHALTQKGVDMFNLFVSCKCLQPLSGCLPTLYSYHWPGSLRMDVSESNKAGSQKAIDVAPRGILRPHIVLNPSTAIPFHSLLMMGLCLQLDEYGVVMGGNPSGAFMLMRVLLGDSSKG